MTLCVLFAGCAVLLLYRTYGYQVVEYQRFRDLASAEHHEQKPIIPRRGDLLDRNGQPLAVSVMYDSLYAYPKVVKDARAVATTLARVTGDQPDQFLAKLQSGQNSAVLLKSKLPEEASTKIASLALPGVLLQREPFRGYPEGSIAPQLLGFVGKDFKGLAGVELSLDKELGGEPGVLAIEQDTAGAAIALGKRELVPPRDGSDALLTIDRYIQRMVERELRAAIKE